MGAIAGVPLLGAIACHCWMLATNFGGVHVGCHCSVPLRENKMEATNPNVHTLD